MIANPPRLPLSSAHIDRHGAYLMDTGNYLYLWIGAAISDQFCLQVLNCASYQSMPETMVLLLFSFLLAVFSLILQISASSRQLCLVSVKL